MPILSIVIGVVTLLILMIYFKLNAFISLLISSLVLGLLERMAPAEIISSIQNGLGSTLGSLTIIIIFGAAVGKLLTESGAAQRISTTMVKVFGQKRIQLASIVTAFVVGIAMFFETGVVVLIPLVFSIATVASVPVLYIGLPVIAALITMHGLVPPHPGPTAIVEIFNANIGQTVIYGIIAAVPGIILGGPVFTKFLSKEFLEIEIPEALYSDKTFTDEEMPSFFSSILAAMLPVILISIKSAVEIFSPNISIRPIVDFVGTASTALLITYFVALFLLGTRRGKKLPELMESFVSSVAGIATILLIIAAGGSFKQVLIDSGIDQYIAGLMTGSAISPIILVWLIAAVLRVSLGSATVAGMTAAGIVAPIVAQTGVNAELMVLAAGAGSIGFSHVNDAGFWIVKEYFNLSVEKTFKTWTVLTSIIGVVSLGVILLLDLII